MVGKMRPEHERLLERAGKLILAAAIQEAVEWRRTYENLRTTPELRKVFAAIDEVVDEAP